MNKVYLIILISVSISLSALNSFRVFITDTYITVGFGLGHLPPINYVEKNSEYCCHENDQVLVLDSTLKQFDLINERYNRRMTFDYDFTSVLIEVFNPNSFVQKDIELRLERLLLYRNYDISKHYKVFPNQVGYISLEKAVDDIIQAFESNSFTALFREFYTSENLNQYSRNFDALREIYYKYDLTKLYGDFVFPKNALHFNLGGTMTIPANGDFPFPSLLQTPFVHFVKRNDMWYIEGIFTCK